MASQQIVLVNPPSRPGTTANREGAAGLGAVDPTPDGFYYPPQTIAYSAAVLRRQGWRVQALDAVATRETIKGTVEALGRQEIPVIGIMVSYKTWETDVAFLQAIRAASPERRVLLFGPATRYLLQQEALELADAVLVGEPELALPMVCADSNGRRSGAKIYHAGELGLPAYGPDGFLTDLDALPHPAWDLLPHAQYPFLTISSSRGCHHACTYCPYVAAQGSHFRARSVAPVVEEMAWLAEQFAPDRVIFRDPVFALDRERIVHLCEALIATDVRLAWECESHPAHFDPELIALMRKAGCTWIKIGLETISHTQLNRLGRLDEGKSADAYRDRVQRVVEAAKAEGLNCRLFVMLGLPNETRQDLKETLAFVRELKPTALNVKAFERYPGLCMSVAEQREAAPPDQDMMAAFLQLRADLQAKHRENRSVLQRIKRRVHRYLAREAR